MPSPVDPDLLRRSAPLRRELGAVVACDVVGVAAAISLAVALGHVVDRVVVRGGLGPAVPWAALAVVAAAGVARAAAGWARVRIARATAGRVADDLRAELVRDVAVDPRAGGRDALALVATRGLDGLDAYVSGYLPALVHAAVATPVLVAAEFVIDVRSGIVVAVTLPLIPVFMALVGLSTRERSARALDAAARLAERQRDLLAGLPTLAALGREEGPRAQIEASAAAHRRATMSTLRLAFLSSMVLELLATLSVALVAVTIGLRLVDGGMALGAGVAALVLAPEVFAPVRAVGARFHEAEDGAEAARRATLALAAGGAAPRGTRPSPPGAPVIVTRGLSVAGRGGAAPRGLDVVAAPGAVTALAGPNGSGKTTALLAVLGVLVPDAVSGDVEIAGIPVGELDRDAWWPRVAWLPQRAAPEAGDTLSTGERHRAELAAALAPAVARAPGGDRVPVAKDVVLADEPTAHLDPATAADVRELLRERADAGCTVLVATHDPRLLAAADAVVALGAPEPAA